jgi:hypothetical protein
MVIASDITRWGFVLEIPTDPQEIEYATVTSSYKCHSWLILIDKDADSNGQKDMRVFLGNDYRAKAVVESPVDAYNLLKKVGYLSEKVTNERYQNIP